MQDCAKYDMMLSASLDGELSAEDAEALEKHLAVCEDCRNYLRLLETVKEGLREELPDPPEALREGIMYKVGLEKHRKLHFGAFGRWTAIAAVLCVVIFGVVKLNGSGVMKSSASEAAPAGMTGGASVAADSVEMPTALDLPGESKAASASPNLAPQLTDANGASGAAGEEADGGEVMEDNSLPGASAGGEAPAPEPEATADSVYRAASLPGYDTARAALDSGEYYGVCLFYGSLPEGLSTGSWETRIPEDGELGRWALSAEDVKALETDADWNEFYYGDLTAARGLVIVLADEEE